MYKHFQCINIIHEQMLLILFVRLTRMIKKVCNNWFFFGSFSFFFPLLGLRFRELNKKKLLFFRVVWFKQFYIPHFKSMCVCVVRINKHDDGKDVIWKWLGKVNIIKKENFFLQILKWVREKHKMVSLISLNAHHFNIFSEGRKIFSFLSSISGRLKENMKNVKLFNLNFLSLKKYFTGCTWLFFFPFFAQSIMFLNKFT